MKVININEFKQYTDDLANKHQTGASVAPAEFNRYCPICVHDVVRRYYGLPELYRYNYTIPPVAYEVTQLLKDYISAYLLKISQQTVTSGKMLIPDDFLHFSSANYGYWVQGQNTLNPQKCDDCCTCDATPCECDCDMGEPTKHFASLGVLPETVKPVWKKKPLRIVNDSQWDIMLDHPIKYPTIQYPLGKFAEKYVWLAPESIKAVNFNYLRYPLRPVWNYDDTTIPGIPVFLPVGSQDIELPEILMKEVGLSILDCVGIQVREPMLQEYAARMKQTGQ